MTIPRHSYDRIQQLRHEITEIAAAAQDRRVSGPEKVKHEKRIQVGRDSEPTVGTDLEK